MKDEDVDFPFRVSPTEQRIIEMVSPSSIILLGRSGTGKTTCAVFRVYGAWLARHTDPDAAQHNMVRPACHSDTAGHSDRDFCRSGPVWETGLLYYAFAAVILFVHTCSGTASSTGVIPLE